MPRWSAERIAGLWRRKYFGYMNDYEPASFVAVFAAAGFHCRATTRWESQELYCFVTDRSKLAETAVAASVAS